MAVTYDAASAVNGTVVTSLSVNHTASGTNRAYVLGVGFIDGADTTFSAVSCGGVAATAVTGGDTTFQYSNYRSKIWYGVAPATSSQPATATFSTTIDYTGLAVLTAAGVDQTTTYDGVAWNEGASPVGQSITSTSGDLTVTFTWDDRLAAGATSSQTRRVSNWASMDTGPGTGTATHTWTHAAGYIWVLGLNLKAASGGGGSPTHFFMSMGVGT